MIHILAGLACKQAGNLAGCLGLAGLPVVPSLGLVWPGPVLPALPWPGPATTTGRLRRPGAASPPLLLLLDHYLASSCIIMHHHASSCIWPGSL